MCLGGVSIPCRMDEWAIMLIAIQILLIGVWRESTEYFYNLFYDQFTQAHTCHDHVHRYGGVYRIDARG